MSKKSSIKRRDFLKVSSASVLAWFSSKLTGKTLQSSSDNPIEEAANKVGKLPRRKFGYSGREVSIIIGSGDLDPLVTEAGILCGMNYWHKANRWERRGGAPETILKNREAHYCQVTVDRVGGRRYIGHLDEDEHYAYVKESLKKNGLGYYDDMQLHYGYHNCQELKNDRAFVRAFERLKKEGLVKHICLSQHSYEGNSRVPNGESAAKVLTAVIKDGVYESAQFMYSYDGNTELDEFMKFARKKNFGTVAMKTARGIGRMREDQEFMSKLPAGVSPHNALVRWLTTAILLDTVVMRVRNIDEFVESYSGAAKSLTYKDKKALSMMTARADSTACKLCSKCKPHCPQKVPITEILRFERYAMDDNDWNKAKSLYAELPTKADSCIKCGTCLEHCPINLNIPEKIARVHSVLG